MLEAYAEDKAADEDGPSHWTWFQANVRRFDKDRVRFPAYS
jgi:hypothetical protein